MAIRYKYNDGTIEEFDDREEFYVFLENHDTELAIDLRELGVEFWNADEYDGLIKSVANGDFEKTTQRDFLDRGLDALSEDLYNGRNKDDWLFGKLMMDKED